MAIDVFEALVAEGRIRPSLLEDAFVRDGYLYIILSDERIAKIELKSSSDYAVLEYQHDLGTLRFAGEHGFGFDGSHDIVPYPLASLFEDEEQVVEKK
jgi:hypothetical protein